LRTINVAAETAMDMVVAKKKILSFTPRNR